MSSLLIRGSSFRLLIAIAKAYKEMCKPICKYFLSFKSSLDEQRKNCCNRITWCNDIIDILTTMLDGNGKTSISLGDEYFLKCIYNF